MVERADPILYETSPLRVGGKRQLSYVIGCDPGRPGGPVEIASGREPGAGEIVLDSEAADELGVGEETRSRPLGVRGGCRG